MKKNNQRNNMHEDWDFIQADEPVELRLMTDPEEDEDTEDADFEEMDENYFGDTTGDCQ